MSFRSLLVIALAATAIVLWPQVDRAVFEARVFLSGAEPLADENERWDHIAGTPPPFFVGGGDPIWSQLGYDVLVDASGRVVAAHRRFGGEELKPWERWRADRVVRRTRFVPFLDENGQPKPARLEWYVTPRPPEKPPLTTVRFPEGDRGTAVVTLVRTGCFGSCPSYWVSVRGDGEVRYCGVSNVKTRGRQASSVPPREALALIERFRTANFLGMEDGYHADITDNPTYVLIFSMGGVEKEVVDYVGERAGMPHVITELQGEVDRVAKSSLWVGTRAERRDDPFTSDWRSRHDACFGPSPTAFRPSGS